MSLCECGCGQETTINQNSGLPNRYIKGHGRRGKKLSEEHKNKLSKSLKGRIISKETRKKISNSLKGEKSPLFGKTGKKFSQEHKDKISKANSGENSPWFGKTFTEEHKRKLSEAKQVISEETKRKLSEINMGKKATQETKDKMSKSQKGRKHSQETKDKMSESHKGDKASNWLGGKSFEPYCVKFNNEFKERVREFFNKLCFNCNKTEEENNRKLSVHHVNYEKMVCCNDVIPLFVTLCISCHGKTNRKREYWEEKFTNELMKRTGGNSFTPVYLIGMSDNGIGWAQLLNEWKINIYNNGKERVI